MKRNLHEFCVKAQVLVQTTCGSNTLTTTCFGCHQSIGHHAYLSAGSQLRWVSGLAEYGVAGSIFNVRSCSISESSLTADTVSLALYIFIISILLRGTGMHRFIFALGCYIRNCENLQEHRCRSVISTRNLLRCSICSVLYVENCCQL